MTIFLVETVTYADMFLLSLTIFICCVEYYLNIFFVTSFLKQALPILLVYSSSCQSFLLNNTMMGAFVFLNVLCITSIWSVSKLEIYFKLIYFNTFYNRFLVVFIFMVWDAWNFDHPGRAHMMTKDFSCISG